MLREHMCLTVLFCLRRDRHLLHRHTDSEEAHMPTACLDHPLYHYGHLLYPYHLLAPVLCLSPSPYHLLYPYHRLAPVLFLAHAPYRRLYHHLYLKGRPDL